MERSTDLQLGLTMLSPNHPTDEREILTSHRILREIRVRQHARLLDEAGRHRRIKTSFAAATGSISLIISGVTGHLSNTTALAEKSNQNVAGLATAFTGDVVLGADMGTSSNKDEKDVDSVTQFNRVTDSFRSLGPSRSVRSEPVRIGDGVAVVVNNQRLSTVGTHHI